MKRIFLVLAVAALALPAAALAKGPSEASFKGPGLGKTVKISGGENEGSPLMNLAAAAGFFPAVFGQEPNPMLPGRPSGDLGPKYALDYTVPGAEGETFSIHQDVYPYAKPYAVTYTAPGQKIFDTTTRGGWYQNPNLKQTLKVRGTAPAVASSAGFFSTGRIGSVIAAVLLLVAAAWIVVRQRSRRSAG